MFILDKILALRDGLCCLLYYQVYIYFCIEKEFTMDSVVSSSVSGFCDNMLKEVTFSVIFAIVA